MARPIRRLVFASCICGSTDWEASSFDPPRPRCRKHQESSTWIGRLGLQDYEIELHNLGVGYEEDLSVLEEEDLAHAMPQDIADRLVPPNVRSVDLHRTQLFPRTCQNPATAHPRTSQPIILMNVNETEPRSCPE